MLTGDVAEASTIVEKTTTMTIFVVWVEANAGVKKKTTVLKDHLGP